MPPRFPLLRWAVLAFVAVWLPSYAVAYDPTNFLNLCDVSVAVTAIGLWTGSPMLLSSQLVGAAIVDLGWGLDIAWTLATGAHLLGGTEYMWDPRFPLWLRLLSCFHLAWPVLLVVAVRRTGYDPRGLLLQAAIALAAITASRLADPQANLNFAFRDPFVHRAWGPGPVHVLLTWAVLVAALYVPTHLALRRLMPRADVRSRRVASPSAAASGSRA
jgi:hypothetical protein